MEIQIHPTEMSQGENGSDEEALQRLTSTIDQKIDEGVQKTESFFSSASIYKVPEYLRMLKESAYTPCLVAIGPLHREDKHLQTPMQHVKMSYTNYLLSRLTAGMLDRELAKRKKLTVLQECLAELKTLVDDAKKCYAEEVTLDEEMMLVDGCFILEFFYGYRTKTECLAEMKTLVDDAKKCYAEEVTLDEEMMLVDGCFILELCYGYRTLTPEDVVYLNEASVFDSEVHVVRSIPFVSLTVVYGL
ncbi:hypothetical protein RHGRI_038909 [Rhododendron griersonianum]|uniref:Uncharacterized protein n=1 Tax=Rhododendron griersonianum TaxID=479676 RepID=A0AAV6HLT7_9ERIC|nr:hypothetical protein RHGRI_038909 [Rhododendron griersonianum]